MPQLDLTHFASQLFWLIITFTILYILISRVAVPRIGGILQSRQDRISNDLDRAEYLKKEAEKIENEYRVSLEKNRAKASQVINAAETEMDGMSKKRHAELDKELLKKAESAERKIDDARKKASAEIQGVASELSRIMVKNLTGFDIVKEKADTAVSKIMKDK